ncbi:protein S100-A12-like [Perognathus longimembris pacificus]|uniref:protein S100-A12-like n=1 Tax=Perognathus longimembris pacificus TaxID=214514 RepID=UPI0020197815|nr:protein S100-A12-like [Perognathus longimembris pacificus]XP_048214173.1 protein S100-A12-like [Perognathus longimembris pacificus]
MLTLEDHMEGIVNIFHQYSVLTGDPETLTKNEMRMLITRELANTIKKYCGEMQGKGENTKDQETVDKIIQELDDDADLLINFDKFLDWVAFVLVSRNRKL